MVQLPDAPVTVQTLAGDTPTAVTRYEAGAPPAPAPDGTATRLRPTAPAHRACSPFR